jgi:hypothetical protein
LHADNYKKRNYYSYAEEIQLSKRYEGFKCKIVFIYSTATTNMCWHGRTLEKLLKLRSLHARVAQYKNCPLGFNTTIELKK